MKPTMATMTQLAAHATTRAIRLALLLVIGPLGALTWLLLDNPPGAGAWAVVSALGAAATLVIDPGKPTD